MPLVGTRCAESHSVTFRTHLLLALVVIGGLMLPATGCSKIGGRITKARRLAQIEEELGKWKPTGKTEDANRRAALLSERAKLKAALGDQDQPTRVAAPEVVSRPPPP